MTNKSLAGAKCLAKTTYLFLRIALLNNFSCLHLMHFSWNIKIAQLFNFFKVKAPLSRHNVMILTISFLYISSHQYHIISYYVIIFFQLLWNCDHFMEAKKTAIRLASQQQVRSRNCRSIVCWGKSVLLMFSQLSATEIC